MAYMTIASPEKSVSKRELNQQTARVLDDIEPGASVLVTERGVPTWRIVRMTLDDDPIERLRQAGMIIPAKQNPRPLPEKSGHPKKGYTDEDIQAILDELREDRI